MTSEAAAYFVDTNILIYIYDAKDPDKRERAMAVAAALAASRRGVLSTQVLKEFCNAVTRKQFLKPEEADDVVRWLLAFWSVNDVGAAEIRRALPIAAAYQMKYYDALILVTARDNGASYILTEDGQSAPVLEGVRYLNPFDAAFDLAQLS